MDNRRRIGLLTVFFSCFFFLLSYAQPSVKIAVDRSEILIGEQFTLKIETGFDSQEYTLKSIAVPDSLQHFEILSRGKRDSVYDQNTLTGISQKFVLTSFDSGKWVLPSFTIDFDRVDNHTSLVLFTDSLPVTVSFSVSDTTNRLRDIKPIRQVEAINMLWYWIGAGVLLIALIVFLIWFYRHWKKNKGTVPFSSKKSPYDEAMATLAELQQHDLSTTEKIRAFHTRLVEILKRYLSRKQGNNYLAKTTGDILIILNEAKLNKETISKSSASLRCGDAVKFAKYLPPGSESKICLESIKEAIGFIEQESKIVQAPLAGNKAGEPKS